MFVEEELSTISFMKSRDVLRFVQFSTLRKPYSMNHIFLSINFLVLPSVFSVDFI
ncbi:hypothetical protein ANAPH1_00390 [Anaplasma phagocytophilum]|nr:hypothetical protein ANAPH1_00390 [Anaplasma phagocytophilum]